MHPRLRLWLIGSLGAILAVVIALGITDESYLTACLITLVILWLLIEWVKGPLPEVWLLAGVTFGYIVGNRGFAQFSPTANLPLLPAEAALLVTVPALVFRISRKQLVAVRPDWLNFSLLAWGLIGAFRLPLDLRAYGFLALRDFAMVYYAVFFFVAQAYAGHAASLRLLQRTLTAAFVVLPVIAIIYFLAPDTFLYLTVRGTPLIFFKSDLLAALLVAGFFWLWSRWQKSRRAAWLIPVALSLLLPGAAGSPRAAMVALAVITLMWLLARRWQIVAAQIAIVGTVVSVTIFIFALGNKNLRETTTYSAYEHMVSIFDVSGTGTYVSSHDSGDPGDNNRFRVVWWSAVWDETFSESPLFGLGFGHDLAARFLADYGLLADEDFAARSPHSMLMSVLGRMGLIGLLLWLGVTVGMAILTRRIFRQGNLDNLGLISVAWVLWLSGCFGIVLEGPMGAVVFWTTLGLANAGSAAEEAPDPAGDPALPAPADLHPAEPAAEVAATP